jgi:hypothetical protein
VDDISRPHDVMCIAIWREIPVGRITAIRRIYSIARIRPHGWEPRRRENGTLTFQSPYLCSMKRTSPRRVARITGLLYLLTIVMGIFAQGFVSERLVASGDAAATATNILAHRSLFEWSFTVYMIEMACQIMTTALFYFLLKPVNRSLALVAAFLSLSGCIIKTFAGVFYLAPLFVLGGAQYLNVFNAQQLQALALLFLKVNDHGAAMALAFFGFEALFNGYLVFRSTFLPRILGILSMGGGLGWLTFLYPPLGYRLFLYLAAFALLGSAAMIFWLIVFGVDEERWWAPNGAVDS